MGTHYVAEQMEPSAPESAIVYSTGSFVKGTWS